MEETTAEHMGHSTPAEGAPQAADSKDTSPAPGRSKDDDLRDLKKFFTDLTKDLVNSVKEVQSSVKELQHRIGNMETEWYNWQAEPDQWDNEPLDQKTTDGGGTTTMESTTVTSSRVSASTGGRSSRLDTLDQADTTLMLLPSPSAAVCC